MELNNLPVVDLELGLKLAGNKKELAEEMIVLLKKTLPEEFSVIKKLHEEENYKELLKRVHRFHGALCYCGLPRLKSVIKELEMKLKRNIMVSLPSLLNQLSIEINLVLEHHSPHTISLK